MMLRVVLAGLVYFLILQAVLCNEGAVEAAVGIQDQEGLAVQAVVVQGRK
jgi:hypothetical protein